MSKIFRKKGQKSVPQAVKAAVVETEAPAHLKPEPEPILEPASPPASEAKATPGYGSGGVYRSIGGGRRVKL